MSLEVKGEYRDIITRDDKIIQDNDWKSNHISEDLGKFISALMRNEDFTNYGITHMAVGSSSTLHKDVDKLDEADFKSKVIREVFPSSNFSEPAKLYFESSNEWAWAKPIENKFFLNQNNQSDDITNTLQINITFKKDEEILRGKNLEFREFALLGTGSIKKPDEEDIEHEIFFINYVVHVPISIAFQKSEENNYTELTRTVKLTFPGGE